MLTSEQLLALVTEAESAGYHPLDEKLRLLERDAAGTIIKAWSLKELAEVTPGTVLLVSQVPLFWAVTDEGTDVEVMDDLAEVQKHHTFLAHMPKTNGKRRLWGPMSRGEVVDTWTRWNL